MGLFMIIHRQVYTEKFTESFLIWLKSSVENLAQNRCKNFPPYFLHSKFPRSKNYRCKKMYFRHKFWTFRKKKIFQKNLSNKKTKNETRAKILHRKDSLNLFLQTYIRKDSLNFSHREFRADQNRCKNFSPYFLHIKIPRAKIIAAKTCIFDTNFGLFGKKNFSKNFLKISKFFFKKVGRSWDSNLTRDKFLSFNNQRRI